VNVCRHAPGAAVRVTLSATDHRINLTVEDDGPGLMSNDAISAAEVAGRMGIAGMRERVLAVGGTMDIGPAEQRGLRVAISMPTAESAA
jgi:signal transduction histidine kinase